LTQTDIFGDGRAIVHQGDCLAVLTSMPEAWADTVITDPPYELAFMGRKWDSSGVSLRPDTWAAVRRAAKPGAMLLAFGGTRTFHRIGCAIEDAGWRLMDTILWLRGSGLVKSKDFGKDIGRAAGAEAAATWDGYGTGLKPAWEPVILAMNPCDGTYANNAITHGVAGLHIDACRVFCGEANPSIARRQSALRPGDVWLLGAHRLMCGDSTKPDDVARLMNGERAGVCFTSPPYAQQRTYDEASSGPIKDWDALMQGVFGNLPMADDGQVMVNLGMIHRDGEWQPYWSDWIGWMRAQGWKRFAWYVWDKGHCGWKEGNRLPTEHEFVWHFCRRESAPLKCLPCSTAGDVTNAPASYSGPDGPDKNRTVAYRNNPTKCGGSVCHAYRNPGAGIDHPAAYPVALPLYFAAHWPGLIYEPFAGSGTTLIAAERLGRVACGMEISPAYCDVAVRRWEEFSGQKATRAAALKRGR
jgi:DNA modification methylase